MPLSPEHAEPLVFVVAFHGVKEYRAYSYICQYPIIIFCKYLTNMYLAPNSTLVRYGENLKRERLDRGLSQKAVAAKMGLSQQGNLSEFEAKGSEKVPGADVIRAHAAAIGCEVRDLLVGVVTEIDRLRWPSLSDRELETLVRKFQPPTGAKEKVLLAQWVESLPPLAVAGRDLRSRLGTRGKAPRIHPRKREA